MVYTVHIPITFDTVITRNTFGLKTSTTQYALQSNGQQIESINWITNWIKN